MSYYVTNGSLGDLIINSPYTYTCTLSTTTYDLKDLVRNEISQQLEKRCGEDAAPLKKRIVELEKENKALQEKV